MPRRPVLSLAVDLGCVGAAPSPSVGTLCPWVSHRGLRAGAATDINRQITEPSR